VELVEAGPSQWRGGLSGQAGIDFDFDFDFERPGGAGCVGCGFRTGHGGAVARRSHAHDAGGVGRVDAGVGDPAGRICGIPAERGGGVGQLERSGSRRRQRAGRPCEPPAGAEAVLREALEDESELVREHAAWALAQNAGG
jgi:hypothetical protein